MSASSIPFVSMISNKAASVYVSPSAGTVVDPRREPASPVRVRRACGLLEWTQLKMQE
jgi:hypothetical protein